jgi:hypothetical protein
MIDVDASVDVPSEQVVTRIQNELLPAPRHAVARETAPLVRRRCSGLNLVASHGRLRLKAFYWRDEPVAFADDGLDEPGFLGIIAKSVPNFANRRIDR